MERKLNTLLSGPDDTGALVIPNGRPSMSPATPLSPASDGGEFGEVYDMLEYAEKYFNDHPKDTSGTLMKSLKKKRDSTQVRIYSKNLMAQTLMAHSPGLVRTITMVPPGHFMNNPTWMAGTTLG